MTALHAQPVPAGPLDEGGAGMSRALSFPAARRRRRRARIEALVAHLIDLLDALDAPDADREPEPDEEDDGEEVAAPLSLNNEGLAPPRRLRRERSAGAEGTS